MQNIRKHFLIKVIAIIVMSVFLHQQIVWAQGDLRESGLPYAAPQNNTLAHINADNIDVPYNLGRKAETYSGAIGETIIHMQDAHASLSAQYSLVNLLDNLAKDYDLNFVALEGAEGNIDNSILKTFPYKDIRRAAADFLMREGRMSAGEFFQITHDEKDIALYGAENHELYQKNLKGFRRIQEERETLLPLVKAFIAQINLLEEKIYSKDLLSFVKKSRLHKNGKLSFIDYWKEMSVYDSALNAESIETKSIDIPKLIKSIELEKTINFAKANEERKELIDELSRKLGKKTLETLVLKSVEFKEEKISPADFHNYLINLAEKNNVTVTVYKNLLFFRDYMAVYESLDIFNLYKEIELFEKDVRTGFYRNSDERVLYDLSYMAYMLEKLYNIELSTGDFEFVKVNQGKYAAKKISAFLREMCLKYNVAIQALDLSKMLSGLNAAIIFYETAAERDKIMIENTLKQMRLEGKKIGALITGGYHTKGLSESMKKNNLSYLIITPKFEKEKDRPYIALLTGRKKAYQSLLDSGEYEISVQPWGAPDKDIPTQIADKEEAMMLLRCLCELEGEEWQGEKNIEVRRIKDAVVIAGFVDNPPLLAIKKDQDGVPQRVEITKKLENIWIERAGESIEKIKVSLKRTDEAGQLFGDLSHQIITQLKEDGIFERKGEKDTREKIDSLLRAKGIKDVTTPEVKGFIDRIINELKSSFKSVSESLVPSKEIPSPASLRGREAGPRESGEAISHDNIESSTPQSRASSKGITDNQSKGFSQIELFFAMAGGLIAYTLSRNVSPGVLVPITIGLASFLAVKKFIEALTQRPLHKTIGTVLISALLILLSPLANFISLQSLPLIAQAEAAGIPIPKGGITVSSDSPWRLQQHLSTLGVVDAYYDEASKTYIAELNLNNTEDGHEQGEIYLDLLYSAPQGMPRGHANLKDETISVTMDIPKDFIGGWIQLFTKEDKDWDSEYGDAYYVTKSGPQEVSHTFTRRLSATTRLLGIKWAGKEFKGNIKIHKMQIGKPGKAVEEKTGPVSKKESTPPVIEKTAPPVIARSTEGATKQSQKPGIVITQDAPWKLQKHESTLAVKDVYYDGAKHGTVTVLELKPGHDSDSQGEVFLELLYSNVPGLGRGYQDLYNATVSIEITIPKEYVGNTVRWFAKEDVNWDSEYGDEIEIEKPGKVIITHTFKRKLAKKTRLLGLKFEGSREFSGNFILGQIIVSKPEASSVIPGEVKESKDTSTRSEGLTQDESQNVIESVPLEPANAAASQQTVDFILKSDGFYWKGKRITVPGANWRVLDQYGYAFGHGLVSPWYRRPIGVTSQKHRIEREFRQIKDTGIKKVRVWLLDDGRAVLDKDGHVKAYDNVFKQDIKTFLDLAEKYEIAVEFTLIDYLIAGKPKEVNGVWVQGRRNIFSNPLIRKEFVDKFVIPFSQDFGKYPALKIIDLGNELEWLVSPDEGGGWHEITDSEVRDRPVPLKDILAYLEESSAAIRKHAPNVLITGGFNSVTYPNLYEHLKGKVSYIAAHYYPKFGSRKQLLTRAKAKADSLGLQIALEEYPSISMEFDNMLKEAGELGFLGADFWNLSASTDDQTSPASRLSEQLKRLKEFIKKHSGLFLWPAIIVLSGVIGSGIFGPAFAIAAPVLTVTNPLNVIVGIGIGIVGTVLPASAIVYLATVVNNKEISKATKNKIRWIARLLAVSIGVSAFLSFGGFWTECCLVQGCWTIGKFLYLLKAVILFGSLGYYIVKAELNFREKETKQSDEPRTPNSEPQKFLLWPAIILLSGVIGSGIFGPAFAIAGSEALNGVAALAAWGFEIRGILLVFISSLFFVIINFSVIYAFSLWSRYKVKQADRETEVRITIGIPDKVNDRIFRSRYLTVLRQAVPGTIIIGLKETSDKEALMREFSERTEGLKTVGFVLDEQALREIGFIGRDGSVDFYHFDEFRELLEDFVKKAKKDIIPIMGEGKHSIIKSLTTNRIKRDFEKITVITKKQKEEWNEKVTVLMRMLPMESLKLIDKSAYDMPINKWHGAVIMRDNISAESKNIANGGGRLQGQTQKYISVSAHDLADLRFIANTIKDLGIGSKRASQFIHVRLWNNNVKTRESLEKYMKSTGLDGYLNIKNVDIVPVEDMPTLGKAIDMVKTRFGRDGNGEIYYNQIIVGETEALNVTQDDRALLARANPPKFFQMQGEGIVSQLLLAMIEFSAKGEVSARLGKIIIDTKYAPIYIFIPNIKAIDVVALREEIENYEKIQTMA